MPRPCLLPVVTKSRQRFLCRNQDGYGKRSGFRQSLVKARRFHVATEICSVAIGFLGIVSQHGILCHDRWWPRPRSLVLQQGNFCVVTEFGHGQEFLFSIRLQFVLYEAMLPLSLPLLSPNYPIVKYKMRYPHSLNTI